MTDRTSWTETMDRRSSEPGAREADHATKLAFELGQAVRGLREQHGWSQTRRGRGRNDSVGGGQVRGAELTVSVVPGSEVV